MEKTLENFYASLKWIENATVDLKFQVDDIEGKIDSRHANVNQTRYWWIIFWHPAKMKLNQVCFKKKGPEVLIDYKIILRFTTN